MLWRHTLDPAQLGLDVRFVLKLYWHYSVCLLLYSRNQLYVRVGLASADTKPLLSGELAINCSELWVDGTFACVVFCRKQLLGILVVLSQGQGLLRVNFAVHNGNFCHCECAWSTQTSIKSVHVMACSDHSAGNLFDIQCVQSQKLSAC